MPTLLKKKKEDFSFLPDQAEEDFGFLPDKQEDTSFLPDQPSVLDRIKNKLPSIEDVGQAAVEAALPKLPPEAERLSRASAAGTARSLSGVLDLLGNSPGFAPAADIGAILPEIAQRIEPQAQGFAERFLSGQLQNKEVSDTFSSSEAEIIQAAQESGQVPYGKILASSLAEGFVAAVRPLIPSNPVEAAELVAIPKAINLLRQDIPFLSRSISDLIFKKKIVVPESALPDVMKKTFEAGADAYTGAQSGKPAGAAAARKVAIETFEREAAAARATAEAQIRGQQAPPLESQLPSTVAPGGVPATEISVPGKVQRNVDVAVENLKRALGAKPADPIEAQGAILGGGTPPAPIVPGPARPDFPGIPVKVPKSTVPVIEPAKLTGDVLSPVKTAKPALPPSGVRYLTDTMPNFAQVVNKVAAQSNPEQLQTAIVEATAEAEAARINGSDPQQAEQAAIDHFVGKLRNGEIAPQIKPQDAPATVQAVLPKPKAIKTDEKGVPVRRPGSVISTVDLGDGNSVKITHQKVLDRAKSIHQEEVRDWERERHDPVRDFVQKHRIKPEPAVGGVVPEYGEWKALPANLKDRNGWTASRFIQYINENPAQFGLPASQAVDINDIYAVGKKENLKKKPVFSGSHYNEALRDLVYEAQEGIIDQPAQSQPVDTEYNGEYHPGLFEKPGEGNLFQVPQENLTQRYQRLVEEGKSQGLNPIQAIKYAKEKLAQPVNVPQKVPSGTQTEFGDAGGVESFGKGREGEQQLFERVDEGYDKNPGENEIAYGGPDEYKKSLEKAFGGLRGYSGDLSKLQKRMEILAEIKDKGFYGIVGSEVRNAQDIAEITSLGRNPAVEILQFLFVKDGKVIAHHAYSLGMPYYIPVPKSLIEAMNLKARQLGAHEVYAVHNHPSGDQTPSEADLQLNSEFRKSIYGYEYHIVHDHEKFAIIRPGGVETEAYKTEKQNYNAEELPAAKSPKDIATFARDNFKNSKATVIYMNIQNKIHGFEYMDHNKINFGKTIANRIRAYKVARYAIAMEGIVTSYKPTPEILKIVSQLPAGLLDIVTISGDRHSSLQETGYMPTNLEDALVPANVVGSNENATLNNVEKLSANEMHRLLRLSEGGAAYGPDKPFYSAVEKTINDKMQFRGNPEQVLGLLRNTPGIKQEEIDWMGLPEFFKGKTSVTKEEVLNFIKENKVEIHEVMKSEKGDPDKVNFGNLDKRTKFEKYVLPGGQNYKELLLTLPSKASAVVFKVETPSNFTFLVDGKLISVGKQIVADRASAEQYVKKMAAEKNPNSFTSQHYKEKDILAHIRFNDRIDAEGKKVLFIEEIQSDWAQGIRADKELPNMPFKKTWHELALKRILRYATENGYDSIAWTTGEMQAERYPRDVDAEKQAQLKGMQGFYDQMIPSFLNKYTKKWGGRVGETKIDIGSDLLALSEYKGPTPTRDEIIAKKESLGAQLSQQLDDVIFAMRRGDSFQKAISEKGSVALAREFGGDLTELPRRTPAVPSLDITPAMKESVMQGQALFEPRSEYGSGGEGDFSKGSQPIDKFEEVESPADQQARADFKLSGEALGIIKKYAERVGERYLPRGAQGIFHPETKNIRVMALNNLSTVSHEVTHYLDTELEITKKMMGTTGVSKTGNPIYDSKYRPIRKELTDIYVEYYPSSLRSHRLKKRLREGIATFLQKYVEHPTIIEEKYPKLVSAFLKPGGEFYQKALPDLIADMKKIVAEYQKLDPLQKVGTRVTSEFQQGKIKDSYLNWKDKFVQETIDNKWPIEKLAQGSGVQRTQQDPSLWVRMYDNSSVPILQNIRGKRGFWVYKGGGFQKVSENNIKTLVDALQAKGLSDDFGYWLVARRQHFDYLKLDELKRGAEEAQKILASAREGEMIANVDIKELRKKIENFRRLDQTLKNDGFDRAVIERAYTDHENIYKPYADMFDKFNQANLDMMADPEVGLLTPKQYSEYSKKDGYASFKRDVFDEIIGPEESSLPQFRVGKTKVSSMISRKGSELSILNPLSSLVKDHAEIMRKSMKQIVYNKMAGIADSFPGLFQRQELKPSIDQRSGAILYPQEKDPNIIMARGPNGERIPYLVSQEIKKIMDELLTYQNVGTLEMLMRTANRWFTKGTTGSYPLFAPTNFLIDQITASAQTRNKYIPIYDTIKQVYKALVKNGSPEASFFEEYLVLGGERQTFAKWQDMEPGELIRAINGERTGLQKVADTIEAGGNILAIPSQMSEIATRVSEYIKSRKNGNSQVVAMEDAGRVSVPFHHRGRYGSGTFGQTFVKSIPFMNPGIQTLAQYYRSVGQKDTRNRAIFVTMAAIAASVGSAIYMAATATDDQKKLYKDLEANELANYLWLPGPDGKRLIKIRIPEQMIVLSTLFNMAMWERGMETQYSVGDYLDAATAFLPDQVNLAGPRRMFLSVIPQIIKPLVGVIYNKKDWPKPRPLVSLGLEYKEPRFQFNENTSKFAKWLGDKLDLSPIKIDYLIEGYLGRVTRFVTGKEISNPFMREWYFTAGRNLQDYYEMRTVTNALANSVANKDRQFSEQELDSIKDQKKQVKEIDQLLKEYRKPKKPLTDADMQELRNKILSEVSMFRQGVKVQ